MGKLVALDIGGKRTGIAETDPLQMIASPREVVATEALLDYLKKWFQAEPPEALILGEPRALDGGDSDNSARTRQWHKALEKAFPALPLHWQDERFSSKRAAQALVTSGVKKQKRRAKGSKDAISAALILEDFMNGRTA